MSQIKFSSDEKAQLVKKIKGYFEDQMGQEIGGFEAEFLLDFFAEQIGPYFYNRALADAQSVMSERLELISEALYELEKNPA